MVTVEGSVTRTIPRWAPYAPSETVLNVIKHFRDSDVPPRIERTRLAQIGVTEGLVGRTWATLVFLGLIEENGTTLEPFRSLRFATDADYAKVFTGILRNAYADIFTVLNPETAQQRDYINAFRPYSPGGQKGRMVTLFMGLCKHAGFALKVQQTQTTKDTATRSAPRKVAPKAKTKKKEDAGATPPAPLGELSDPNSVGGSIQIFSRDLAELGEEEFHRVWDALGIVYRARGQRQKERDEATQVAKVGVQLPMLEQEDGT